MTEKQTTIDAYAEWISKNIETDGIYGGKISGVSEKQKTKTDETLDEEKELSEEMKVCEKCDGKYSSSKYDSCPKCETTKENTEYDKDYDGKPDKISDRKKMLKSVKSIKMKLKNK